jgi:hypothetical protein
MLLCIIFVLVNGVACKSETLPEKKDSTKEVNNKNVKKYSKEVFIEKEDDWIYYLHITKIENVDKMVFSFDGINLKYNKLDNYYVPVRDTEGNEIDRAEGFPMLSRSAENRNEIKEINNFLNNKQFIEDISEKDLLELELKSVNKEDLINLVNKSIKAEFIDLSSDNDMLKMTFFDNIQNEIDDNTILQLSYYNPIGGLYKVKIEVISVEGENNIYLSDKIADGSASSEEKDMYANFKKMGESIVKSQKFDIQNEYSNLSGKYYEKVFEILNNLQTSIKK